MRELEKVDALLGEMVNKYDRQRVKLDNEIKEGLRRKEDRQILLQKMKKKKLVIFYMSKCRDRINVILQKKFAVEQLNLTAMQIDALKSTSSVFKTFNKKHNIDKIEELQSTMEELTDSVLEIDEALSASPMMDFDEEELLAELDGYSDDPVVQPIGTIEMPVIGHSTVLPDSEEDPQSLEESERTSLLVGS